jgi:hypothetical protein
MSIQHSAIADADRHEPKGASTATARQVILSNGDGTTKFDSVDWSDLTGKPSTPLSVAILSSASTAASQNPAASDTATDVVFGGAITAADASLDASGQVTFNTGGSFSVQASLNFGRDSGTNASILYVMAVKNGVAYGSPVELRLNQAVDRHTLNLNVFVAATAGDTFKFQFVTDSDGDGGGGLRQDTPTISGWPVVPCAKLTVSKFTTLS